MSEPLLSAIIGALFGAVIGSFLNVCIVRLPAEQSVVSPPSRCPKCGKGVEWRDNIPVLSWLLLGGKCRGCREPISIMYPLVELGTALIWALVAWQYGLSLLALKGAIFGTLLLGIALTDAREYIIPNEFTYGGLAIGLLLSAAGGVEAVLAALIGAAVGFAILWIVGVAGKWAFKEEAMGGGDIKMMAMVGAFVGWQGVLLTVFLGALLGTLIFVPIQFFNREKLVPFGIFLALGAAATWIAGSSLLAWYTGYVGL